MFATHPHYRVPQAAVTIVHKARFLSHAEARRIAGQAIGNAGRKVVIDLALADDATTSAFAEFILLRRSLLRTGRDLCLTGLRDRTASVFTVNRLDKVLPTA
jgi:anti-anti-sigma regulatory factor